MSKKYRDGTTNRTLSVSKEISSKEFMEKYGNVMVKFSSYYKFTFTFRGEAENGKKLVVVKVGGNSDDIYRQEVSNDSIESVNNLQPYSGSVYEDGKETEHFYCY